MFIHIYACACNYILCCKCKHVNRIPNNLSRVFVHYPNYIIANPKVGWIQECIVFPIHSTFIWYKIMSIEIIFWMLQIFNTYYEWIHIVYLSNKRVSNYKQTGLTCKLNHHKGSNSKYNFILTPKKIRRLFYCWIKFIFLLARYHFKTSFQKYFFLFSSFFKLRPFKDTMFYNQKHAKAWAIYLHRKYFKYQQLPFSVYGSSKT